MSRPGMTKPKSMTLGAEKKYKVRRQKIKRHLKPRPRELENQQSRIGLKPNRGRLAKEHIICTDSQSTLFMANWNCRLFGERRHEDQAHQFRSFSVTSLKQNKETK